MKLINTNKKKKLKQHFDTADDFYKHMKPLILKKLLHRKDAEMSLENDESRQKLPLLFKRK